MGGTLLLDTRKIKIEGQYLEKDLCVHEALGRRLCGVCLLYGQDLPLNPIYLMSLSRSKLWPAVPHGGFEYTPLGVQTGYCLYWLGFVCGLDTS